MSSAPPPPPNVPPGGQVPHSGAPQPPAAPQQPGYGQPQQQQPYGQPQQQPYGGAPAYAGAASMEKPQAIRLAQMLMYAGGALGLVSILVSFLTLDSLVNQLAEQTGLPADQLRGAAMGGLIFGSLIALIGVGLWFLMAWANGNGQNWARITASVFFGISVLYTLFILVSPNYPGATKGINLISLLLGGGIIYLLWGGKGSNDYFRAMSGPR